MKCVPTREVKLSDLKGLATQDIELLGYHGFFDDPLETTLAIIMPNIGYIGFRFNLNHIGELNLIHYKDEFGLMPGYWYMKVESTNVETFPSSLKECLDYIQAVQN